MKILTFDIEEWFHILDHSTTKTNSHWEKYEVRIHKNVDRILELLELTKHKATFFVVGWIAEKYPEVINKIDKQGYQIGSHSHMHQLVYEQTRQQFSEDLKKSINTIEDITGKKVKSFRAPGFSITEKNIWAFEELFLNGITHDSSVFPAVRAHGGFPTFKETKPTLLEYNGVVIKEFPINTVNMFGNRLIYSGGGYFRALPYWLIRKWASKSDYVMTYFHPRDFDPNQPIINGLSAFRKFKSYVGLKSCYSKLLNLSKETNFLDLETADRLYSRSNSQEVSLF